MQHTAGNPYSSLPDYAFWRRAVAGSIPDTFDPVVGVPFTIAKTDRVATAGSCFAQHISRALLQKGFNYDVTEPGPLTEHAVDENYRTFPARFGNIYTTRQLLQLFDRAYGLLAPTDGIWARTDGCYLDPFRPLIQSAGFPSADAVDCDRTAHLAAVKRMFETCQVFIFTLGLTEAWVSDRDGTAVPLAPGVAGFPVVEGTYSFRNLSVCEMTQDILTFIDRLRTVNKGVRIILTVSPVPLIATYEKRHVLLSTIYSKSALRVVAEIAAQERQAVAYFPSYEIIVGPQSRYGYFSDDLRTVSQHGIDCVMKIFSRHFLTEQENNEEKEKQQIEQRELEHDILVRAKGEFELLNTILCDEEELDR